MTTKTAKTTKVQLDQMIPAESEIKKDLQEEKKSESSSFKLINAEEATKVAIEFLKSLGIKKTVPCKAFNEADKAHVELDLKGKKAALLVDGNTKEILEYEIEAERRPAEGGGSLSLKLILILVGIQFGLVILFDFIKQYIPLP